MCVVEGNDILFYGWFITAQMIRIYYTIIV